MACIFSSADRTLAARLEAADAANVMTMTGRLGATMPDAACEPFAGGIAVFAGAGSPMTHAVGVGLRGNVPENEMERMEAFFRQRGTSCLIDLCPLADASVLGFVQTRPYRVTEFNNVLVRRITADEVFEPQPGLRLVHDDEIPNWSRLISEGFSEHMPVSDEMVNLLATTCKGSQCWYAGEKRAVAGAAMSVEEGVALFLADVTLTDQRGQGWQSRLIRARLATAQRQGCELAMASVLPGTVSHRNYERAGFQLVYMRVNVCRDFN